MLCFLSVSFREPKVEPSKLFSVGLLAMFTELGAVNTSSKVKLEGTIFIRDTIEASSKLSYLSSLVHSGTIPPAV